MDFCNFCPKMGICKPPGFEARYSAHIMLTISVSGSSDEEYVWTEGIPEGNFSTSPACQAIKSRLCSINESG